ncbi:MAG: DUF1702 family protein [Mastigocoleus sp. MO_167.B18]|uniref:DUF1702 family protein n=1 Tax=Mastigocoleus sp. MO_188.B34 TaxID=3036635 RepID=UPI00260A9F9A|nr:DUF1702 family protein [Mastigocoleus sp. MO_188.B34]MDJ0697858.1 DUF1702 family protein [Mastigocoleus sp. MO_188.B34]MDJ0772696.1 DUF1702 family protein [Mastigocoleus sp. MO_167.B18]
MINHGGQLRRYLFGHSIETMDNTWKHFPGTETEARKRIRLSSNAFIKGYNTALEVGLSHILLSEIQSLDINLRGFAYEGASMGLAMIDYIGFGKQSRFQKFVDRNPNYKVLIHVGAGFVISVFNQDIEKSLSSMEPMQRWWAMDGYGFHHGITKWKQSVHKQIVPKKVIGYARRAFDRGLGRSIWFLLCGDINRIVEQLQKFPESRRADMWSGIGVGSTYAGGVSKETLENVKAAAGSYRSYVSLGCTQAARDRYLGNNIVEHNDLACSVYCGMSTESVAKMTIEVMEDLNIDTKEKVFVEQPIYEIYREKIRTKLLKTPVTV